MKDIVSQCILNLKQTDVPRMQREIYKNNLTEACLEINVGWYLEGEGIMKFRNKVGNGEEDTLFRIVSFILIGRDGLSS